MGLLTRIKGLIGRHVVADEPEPEPDHCLHEEDDRMAMARMGYPNAFICRACGYREEA